MPTETVLEHYAREALNLATIEPLDDGSFVGRVPGLDGAIAFGDTERECVVEVYSVVEDWARFRVERGLNVPILGSIDLNTEENRKLVLQYS
jgi:predicted RNase H-like HicB family nuclease